MSTTRSDEEITNIESSHVENLVGYKQITLSVTTQLPLNPINKSFIAISEANKNPINSELPSIINLGIGAPHINPPNILLNSKIDELILNKSTVNYFGYPPSEGRDETRDAAVKLYKEYYPLADYKRENLIVTSGAINALKYAFQLLLNLNDKVIVFEPYFSYYLDNVKEYNGVLIAIPTIQNKFRPKAKDLEVYLKNHADVKAIILNYPNNPSGIDLTEQEIKEIADVLKKYPKVAIISDDVYIDFAKIKRKSIVEVAPELLPNTFLITSASKGLVGWPSLRIGFMATNADWIEKIANFQDRNTGGPSVNAELIAIKAIHLKLKKHPEYVEWLDNARKTYQENVTFFSSALKELGFELLDVNTANNGFYVLARADFLMGKTIPDEKLKKNMGHDTFETDIDVSEYLVQKARVGVIPGSPFGVDANLGYLRFSCAKELGVLKEAIRRIQSSLQHDNLLISSVSSNVLIDNSNEISLTLSSKKSSFTKMLSVIDSPVYRTQQSNNTVESNTEIEQIQGKKF